MSGNDNNTPVVQSRYDAETILSLIDPDIRAQELVDRCLFDKNFNVECTENEQTLWTYLLHRDYPQWGVIGKAKEYYTRIAAVHGIALKNTTSIANISGSKLVNSQRQTQLQRPILYLQVENLPPFPIADVVARTYSGALKQVLDNLERYQVTDANRWIFRITDEDLNVDHQQGNWAQSLSNILTILLSDNILDEHGIRSMITPDIEAEVIAAFDLLQCQEGLCDVLTITVTERLNRLSLEVIAGNVSIEPVKLVRVEFGVAPGAVVLYFQALSNLLFINDAFTEDIIEYYRDLIRLIPGIKLSLMPRGYPFIKRQNLDKFDSKLFHVNPLVKPIVFPDYLTAKVFGEIDQSNPDFDMWRSEDKPYPIITSFPDEPTIKQRMETVLPGVNSAIQILQLRMGREFPNREAGFIVAGGMFSIIFDDYLSTKTNWLLKTDADFFVYGRTHELRVRAFTIIMEVLISEYPMGPETRHKTTAEMPPALHVVNGKKTMAYSVFKSVVTAQRYEYLDRDLKPVSFKTKYPRDGEEHGAYRVDQYERSLAFQVINTNSKDGFEVIMNFDTSHIQVGFDCYDGWMATPYWELYYPRREALLVRYNIRGSRFTKALYRGFVLKTLMPYALLLKMTGEDYAGVIRPNRIIAFAPRPTNGKYPFPDDLKPPRAYDFGHRPLVQTRIITKDVEIIHTGDNTDLENPSRIATSYVKWGGPRPEYHETTVKDLGEIFERIKYDGQFKNGFDGYVNSAYLTFKIAPAPQEHHSSRNKLSKFLLRDARLVGDPRVIPVEFPTPGTEAFKWSIMTEVLVHSKTLMPIPQYYLGRAEVERPVTQMATIFSHFNSAHRTNIKNNTNSTPVNARKVAVLAQSPFYWYATVDKQTQRLIDEKPKVYRHYLKNPDSTRAPTDTDALPRHNLSLVAKSIVNVDFPDPKVFGALKPKDAVESGGDLDDRLNMNYSKKTIIHQYFNFPILIEGVVSFDSQEDFDSLDLHAPMLTDEQRDQLPRLTYEQFNDVALGRLKLDFTNTGYSYIVTFPASVSESIFLDESDWTMSLNEALGNRDLRFNSICIFEYPILAEDDPNKPFAIKIEPGLGDEEFFANPPSLLKIFRSFKIM